MCAFFYFFMVGTASGGIATHEMWNFQIVDC